MEVDFIAQKDIRSVHIDESFNTLSTAQHKAIGNGCVAPRRRSQRQPSWVEMSDENLLDMRLCDLGLRLEQSPLAPRIQRFYSELERRGIRFRPHFWLSDDWFSPDGTPGVAVPFYLAHPRLARLERKMLLEVEGGTEDWCMRIIRHEAGHAIDTAYRLHRRASWRKMFGRHSDPYPEYYRPKPYSKSFVLHLDLWYAQSHPSEDFAETFAVWMRPRSPWRTQYQDWPALKKLEYVDQIMAEVRTKRPLVNSRRHVDSLRTLRKTLREHYDEKLSRYMVDQPHFYDRDLHRLFGLPIPGQRQPSAAAFLRRNRSELRKNVAHWTSEFQYTIDQVLGEMIDRCRELDLRLDRPEPQVKRDALVMLTVQIMNYLHDGHHRIAI